MPEARAKCSNCGAELSNLSFGWGQRQWLWGMLSVLPLLLIPLWIPRMMQSSQNFGQELQVKLTEAKSGELQFDVLGELTNSGTHTWDNISVEAELFDDKGKFLDEQSIYTHASMPPGAVEHFRISFHNPDNAIIAGSPKVVLKVANASEDRY